VLTKQWPHHNVGGLAPFEENQQNKSKRPHIDAEG
jgi:hypothetical protein